jgi:hypothetical protein
MSTVALANTDQGEQALDTTSANVIEVRGLQNCFGEQVVQKGWTST